MPALFSLLLSEYRFIKSMQEKIRKNAAALYNYVYFRKIK